MSKLFYSRPYLPKAKGLYITNAYIGIMTFIRYKKFGRREYAYEVKTYWNKETKKPRQKNRYLGVVIDKDKKLFRMKRKEHEKLILDFGDAYILHNFLEKIRFVDMIKKAFADKTDYLLSLLSYKLCYGSAMRYARTWFEGSYAKMQYKDVDLSSQRISEFLKTIGDEKLQRDFFKDYISKFTNAKNGIIIDATSLPNQIHIPFSTWGLHGEEIDKQIRFLLVVEKESSMPLFFRYLPGNIVDVSALDKTLKELQKYGIKESFVYLDGGFFSEDNIRDMYSGNVNFLTRLPSNRCLYKDLIRSEARDLENASNIAMYGKRGLFIKQKKINLFGKEAYAHIVLDPERKGRETKKLLIQTIDEKSENPDLEYDLLNRGIMILVSSFEIKKGEVVPAYYVRQTAEKMFGFSKDDLSLVPVRIHSEEVMRGLLFLQFLSLIAFVQLKDKIGKEYTVEDILLAMRNLKCKVYDDEILVSELTKQQKDIEDKVGILMPKKLGI